MSLLKIKPFSIDQTDTFTFANANIAANLFTGNANLGNLATANFFSGNANALFNIQGGNVVGTVANATLATNVTASAQGNITSVGSLVGLTVSNATGIVDFTTTANVTLGGVANLHITGGTDGQFLKTNGSGVLTWSAVAAGTGNANIAGANTQIFFNNANNSSLGASANLTFDSTTKTLTVDLISANGSGLTALAGANVTGTVANANNSAYLGGTIASSYLLTTGTGSSLTAITGANVTGFVPNANVANTAFAVTGSNVSGQVGNALIAGTVYTNAQPNITSVGTLSSLDVTGNIASGNANLGNLVIANFFSGSGANLTSIAGANVTGFVPNANVANTAFAVTGSNVSGQVGNALIAGTVYTNAQPNITSVGTLTSLSVTGDIGGANLTLTGNLIVGGTTTSVNSTVTRVVDPIFELGGGANGAALIGDDNKDRGVLLHYYSGAATVDAFMGWDDSNGEFGVGSDVSVTGEVVTWNSYGNLRANVYFGNGSQLTGVSATSSFKIANGTSNVNIATVDGNVTVGVGGTAGVVTITTTGVNIAGYANLGSGNLITTGNIQGGYVIGNGSSLTSLTGANVTGQVANALISGTVYTNAQPNITSVGTLTGVTSTGIINLTGTSNVALGAIGNVHITGGSANYFLKTDGSGGLSWSALPSTTISVDTYTGDGTWTMQTLSSTPVNINYTLVAIGGVFQPRDAYAVTGAVITFDDPPPNGAIVEITIINGGTAGSLGYVYQGINSSTTAIAGVRYLIDTTAAVTLTLPASASLGDEVGIIDATGNAGTQNITIARNGGNIEGSASNLTLTVNRSAITLVYYNSTQGWVKTQK
jgi:hypothetical protein